MEAGFDVGTRLRQLREQAGLSQRELAKRSGVTNATISLIEHNRISPSIASLKKVLDGLPLSLAEFFAGGRDQPSHVFFPADTLQEIGKGGISYRQVGGDLSNRALQILHERYAPGSDTGKVMLSHEGEEGGIILRGRLEVTVGDQQRVLGPGDAYFFDSRLPHRFRAVGPEEVELVSACTPPSF